MQTAHPREATGAAPAFTQADVEAHPLFVLVRNAMIEAALTGIVPPEVIVEQLTPVPRDLPPSCLASPELDEAMLKLLRLQQSFIQEHKDVNRLCEEATSASFQAITRLTGEEVEEVPGQGPVNARMPPIRQTVPVPTSPFGGHYYPPKQDGPRLAGAKRPYPTFQYYPHNGEVAVSQGGRDGQDKRRKHCGLDQGGADVLRAWILRNWKNPYPSEATKTNLVMATGFTRVQVNNWFINSRRRLIKKHTPEQLERMAQELEEQDAIVESNNGAAAHDPRLGTVAPAAVFRSSDSDDESTLSPAPMQLWCAPPQRPRRDYDRPDCPSAHMYPRMALELPNILNFPNANTAAWAPPPLPLVAGALAEMRQQDGGDGGEAGERLVAPEAPSARREKDTV